MDSGQLEETFRCSVRGRVRLFTDGDEIPGIKTLWDIGSEQLREKFANTTASDLTACEIQEQVVQETDYELLMSGLGSDLCCVPFINAPWNGEIPQTRDDMIEHISGDMTLYNKELVTRGSKLATGLLVQAIIKGDAVFEEFPRSVLPFSAHNPSHVAKFTEEEIPCLLWDPQTIETIAEAFTYTAYHGKLRNTSLEAACTTYFPIATARAWNKTPCAKINQAFVTVAFPKTMDIPETWCRGILLYHRVHMLFEEWLRGFTTERGEPLHIEPLVCAVSIEGHYGSKGHRAKKKKVDEADGEQQDEEDKVKEQFDALRKSTIELCGSLLYRDSLKGSAHVHCYLVCLTPGGRSFTVLDWQSCFKNHLEHHIHTTTVDQFVQVRKAKTSKPHMQSQLNGGLAKLKYCVKGSTCQRSTDMVKRFTRNKMRRAARIIAYDSEYTDLFSALEEVPGSRIDLVFKLAGDPHTIRSSTTLPPHLPAWEARRRELSLKLYNACRASQPIDGKLFTSPRKQVAGLRHVDCDPDAFSMTLSMCTEVRNDLQTNLRPLKIPPSPPSVTDLDALKEFIHWLELRMPQQYTFDNSVCRFIIALAMYKYPRKEKAKQPYVFGEPDCGKTTLARFVKKAYHGFVFSVTEEYSGTFMGQEFVDKRDGAIWIEEEITPRKFRKMPDEIFNKVVEGQRGFTVCIKRMQPETVTSSLHVLMSNFALDDFGRDDFSHIVGHVRAHALVSFPELFWSGNETTGRLWSG